MGERTIPAPHPDEVNAARMGIQTQAELHGLDMTDPNLLQFLEQQVVVRAQMAAETRWLRNLLNEKLVNS